jgi:hypothetical protein
MQNWWRPQKFILGRHISKVTKYNASIEDILIWVNLKKNNHREAKRSEMQWMKWVVWK